MSRLFNTAASGMRSHASAMEVHGQNIANLNTNGYKSARPSFATLFSQTMRPARGVSQGVTGLDPIEVGAGVRLASTSTQFQQGALAYTGQNLDLAILGRGFFMLKSELGEPLYTRDGAFSLQADGTLIHTASGNKVQGMLYDAATGLVPDGAVPEDIVVPPGMALNAKSTAAVSTAGNLDATTAAGGSAAMQFRYYDSFGVSHTMNVTFTRAVAPNTWDWTATIGATSVGSGTLVFSPTGDVASGGSGSATLTSANGGVTDGATSPQTVTLDFSRLTQYAEGSEVEATDQDGYPPGAVLEVGADDQGRITAVFTNGQTRPLAQLALVSFANPQGLSRAADNLLRQTANTGTPQVVAAGGAGVGTIQAQAVERSNVDLPTELTSLIIYQRGYQASARLVSTADEMLQEALNLKR